MSDATVRIRQAMRRAAEFQTAIQHYLAEEPFRPDLQIDDDRRAWQVVLRISKPVPVDDWSILLGEIIHHLRSGLNNVLYNVASKYAGGTPRLPRSIQFPIFSTETDFDKNADRFLGEARSELYDIVRAFQPFGGGDDFLKPGPGLHMLHPMDLLNELSNDDKHRHWRFLPLVPSLIQFDDENGYFSIEFDSLEGIADPAIGPIELPEGDLSDGAIVVRQTVRAPLKAIVGHGRIQVGVAVSTDAGPVDATVLSTSLVFIAGLIMLRMEDTRCGIDEIYSRLSAAMAQ
jgi:hypothetical protein